MKDPYAIQNKQEELQRKQDEYNKLSPEEKQKQFKHKLFVSVLKSRLSFVGGMLVGFSNPIVGLCIMAKWSDHTLDGKTAIIYYLIYCVLNVAYFIIWGKYW